MLLLGVFLNNAAVYSCPLVYPGQEIPTQPGSWGQRGWGVDLISTWHTADGPADISGYWAARRRHPSLPETVGVSCGWGQNDARSQDGLQEWARRCGESYRFRYCLWCVWLRANSITCIIHWKVLTRWLVETVPFLSSAKKDMRTLAR